MTTNKMYEDYFNSIKEPRWNKIKRMASDAFAWIVISALALLFGYVVFLMVRIVYIKEFGY